MIAIWRSALIVFVLFLGWRALSLGLADFYSRGPQPADPAKTQAALAWNPADRRALAALGAAQAQQSAPASQGTWRTLLRLDPANSTALIGLAQTLDDRQQADALIAAATALNPSNPTALKQAGIYWLRHDALERATAAWSAAMAADPGVRPALYPLMLKLFEDPGTRALIAPYIAKPPVWWDGFFGTVASSAPDIETVRKLAALRRSTSTVAFSEKERAAYVARLRSEGLMTEAYLTWVDGLDDVHRQRLGPLNNGSFESEPLPDGWDWQFKSSDNLVVELVETVGAHGRRALHLAFRGFEDNLKNVYQDLFLEPGAYRLTGMVRPSGLKTTGGLQWAVDCWSPGRNVRIAETERFVGSSAWQTFALNFAIPADCIRPVLRLVAAVRVAGDRRIEGGIWFDSLSIQRREVPSSRP